MKKPILMALFCALTLALGVSSVYHAAVGATNNVSTLTDVEKTPVKKQDLPAVIKTALAKDYKDWTVTEAYAVKDGEAAWYEVSLKKAQSTMFVKFDKEGKRIS